MKNGSGSGAGTVGLGHVLIAGRRGRTQSGDVNARDLARQNDGARASTQTFDGEILLPI